MRMAEEREWGGRARQAVPQVKGRRAWARTAATPLLRLFGGWSVEAAAAVLAVCILAWASVNLLIGGSAFAQPVPEKLHGSEEAVSALVRFFAALVMGLFLVEDAGWRVRWVAGGLVVLGLGHLAFGYVEPLVQNDPLEPNESLYEGFVTQTFACALFAVGLLPGTPFRVLKWAAATVPASLVLAYVVVFEFLGGDDWMPPLVNVEDLKETAPLGSPLEFVAPLHWVLSALPLGLAIAAAGTFWQSRRGMLRGWILFAMVLLAGSRLHDYLWPSAFGSEVFTTADMLSLAFAVVVAVGGVSELRASSTR